MLEEESLGRSIVLPGSVFTLSSEIRSELLHAYCEQYEVSRNAERTVRTLDPDGRAISGVRLHIDQTNQVIHTDERVKLETAAGKLMRYAVDK